MERIAFESTTWVTIRRAAERDADALEQFVARYRPPILAYLRRKGFNEHDAEDLSQEVFIRLLTEGALDRADAARGRFRLFLLGLTRHLTQEHMRARGRQKRAGDRRTFSVNEYVAILAAPPQQDEAFDRLWLERMLDLTLEKLGQERPDYHRVLTWSMLEGVDQKTMARRLGRTVTDVKNFVRRAREFLRAEIRGQIASYCSSSEEYEDEIKTLSRYLDATA